MKTCINSFIEEILMHAQWRVRAKWRHPIAPMFEQSRLSACQQCRFRASKRLAVFEWDISSGGFRELTFRGLFSCWTNDHNFKLTLDSIRPSPKQRSVVHLEGRLDRFSIFNISLILQHWDRSSPSCNHMHRVRILNEVNDDLSMCCNYYYLAYFSWCMAFSASEACKLVQFYTVKILNVLFPYICGIM